MKTTVINPFTSSDATQRVSTKDIKRSQKVTPKVAPTSGNRVTYDPTKPKPGNLIPTQPASVVAMDKPVSKPSTPVLDLNAEIARLQAENAKLKAAVPVKGGVSFKVSEKGALSVYGLGRFPVTLYKSQWATLFEIVPAVKAFIEANDDKLKNKEEKVKAEGSEQ